MTTREESVKIIEDIIFSGTSAEKKCLFGFNKDSSDKEVLKQFQLFSRSQYVRYFKGQSAPFHDEMSLNMILSYRGKNYINLAFRGSAKTTLAKLFIVFVLLNDEDHANRYIKILSRDLKNPKQIVTDVYNMMLEVKDIYGDVFEKEGDKKREETMSSFTMKCGVKLSAGTVGQAQRGHAQDAYRPDWIWFDDIEDRESVSSAVITNGIISQVDEAITGLAKGGSWMVTGNYISEYGVVKWFLNKSETIKQITPISQNNIPTWSIYTQKEIDLLEKDSEDFFGEYMCDPTRSEGKYFNREKLDAMVPKKPIKDIAGFKIFKEYNPAHRYAGGMDIAGGVGLDSSTSVFIDFNTFPAQVVGTFASNTILPEAFGDEIYSQANRFGGCLIAPENNRFDQAILKAKQLGANIYTYTKSALKIVAVTPTTYGWNTNSLSKSTMLSDLREAIESGLLDLNDEDLIAEVKSYTRNDLIDSPPDIRMTTRHFDLLTACAIAWQMKDHARVTKIRLMSESDFRKDTNIAI